VKLARIALILLALLVLAIGALLAILPRLLASESARARIESAAESALGREVRYQSLDVSLFPPSLVLVAPVVAGEAPGAPAFVEARKLSLRVALLPLLARTLLVDRLVVEGATLRLRRGAQGLELPKSAEPEAAAAPAEPAPASGESGAALALRALELRDSRILFEDAAVSPPVSWDLTLARARLRGESLDRPLSVDAQGELASGGRIEVKGTAALGGDLDLDLSLADVALASLTPYLGGARVAGRVSGTVEIEGPARSPRRAVAKLSLADGDVLLDEIALRGPLDVRADLAGGGADARGSFDLDATRAELVYGGSFRKPPGTAATVSGRLVGGAGGALGVDDLKLRVKNLDATGTLRRGRRTQLDLEIAPFDLAGWQELLPPLTSWQLGGSLAPEALSFATDPLEVHGRLTLSGVRGAPLPSAAVELHGTLVGEGERMHSEGLVLSAAGQPIPLDLELAQGAGEPPRLRLQFEAKDADAERVLAAFTGKDGMLRGRLDLDGDLRLPLSGPGAALDRLAGRFRFEIRSGSLGKAGIAEASFDALANAVGPLGLVTDELLALGGKGGKNAFERVGGSFRVDDGVARTDDLQIAQHGRTIDLNGAIRLSDLGLDMKGTLRFDEPVGAAIGLLRPGKDDTLLAIPIAHVGGTLEKPDVRISPEAASSFAAALRPVRKVEGAVEKGLDSKAARDVVEGIEGLLRRR
jgi:uncharacterized protein involved in outer membrane biogenesis